MYRTTKKSRNGDVDEGADNIMADTLIGGTTLVETKTTMSDFKKTGTAGYDFTVGDFTTDGNLNQLDLSAIVPEGTKWVYLRIRLADNLTNQFIRFSDTDPFTENRIFTTTQVANIALEETGFISLASDRILYYVTSATTFTELSMKVMGYI